MIFARDKGRMCNNLLQYGHVYAWAREQGRKSVSMRFCYKYPYFHIRHTPWHNPLVYAFVKFFAWARMLTVVSFNNPDERAESLEHKLSMMRRHSNIVVEGWYVRFYDLFLKYRDEITALFAFEDEVMKKAEETMPAAEVRIGVHVRRGDYKTFCDGKYYFDDDVYIRKVQEVIALHPEKSVAVVICGNDPALNKEEFRRRISEMRTGIEVVFPKGNPGEDLCALSLCDCLIGPPSTFSLVAAMYRDIPLCWVSDKNKVLTEGDFDYFHNLFRHIT